MKSLGLLAAAVARASRNRGPIYNSASLCEATKQLNHAPTDRAILAEVLLRLLDCSSAAEVSGDELLMLADKKLQLNKLKASANDRS